MKPKLRCSFVLVSCLAVVMTAHERASAGDQLLFVDYSFDGNAWDTMLGQAGFIRMGGFKSDITEDVRSNPILQVQGSDSATSGNALAYGDAFATAQIGSLGVSFNLIASGGHLLSTLSEANYVIAHWVDDPFLRGPTPGRLVKIHASLKVHGTTFSSPAGNANTAVQISGTSITGPHGNDVWAGSTFGVNLDPPNFFDSDKDNIPDSFIVPVVLAGPMGQRTFQDFKITLSGSALASVLEPNFLTSTAAATYGQTLTWNGISSVEDATTGEVINDWSLISDSGFDYAKPFGVPEPSTFVLVVSSFCVLGLVRRRTQKSIKD